MKDPGPTEAFPLRATPGSRCLDEVVLQAAALEEEDEREAYLQEIAAADPALASLVRQRLAAADGISTFLERPAAERLGDLSDDQEPAAEVPSPAALPPEERYELGECLGRGGMARVVEAYDHQLDRRVALKFLTSEKPAIRALFLREGRAQARVRHPHVLDIYDSGELEGQAFLSMHRVDGGTLTEVAPRLSLEHKIRLLIQVAEGLHAAHRQGLLHQDVKPANVLVEETPDGDLTAYVSDFGIATDLADERGLAGNTVLGSPQYIAPERLEGPAGVDRRSDVYSLGVAMYRILTGSLPFEGSLTVDVLRRTLRSELPPPREKNPNLPAEVEAIILRCVARDPDERYASARAVAEDLRRFLNGEVVEAFAAGLAYRTTRFVLRHRLLVGMAALAVAVLFVASIAVMVFAVRADAAREEAELRQGQAEELIRFMVVDLQKKLEPVSRLEVLDDVGRAATDYFAAVPEGELSEEELLRRSRMLYQLGNLRIRQGDLSGALEPMEESLALTQRLHDLAPDDTERLFELGQSWFWVGFVDWKRGDLAAARGPFEEYLEISRQLVEAEPDNLDWQLELAYAHSNLGSVLQAEDELERASNQFRASLAIKKRLVSADPTNRGWRTELAAGHNTIGVVLQALGRLEEAREHFEAELELLSALLEEDPNDLRTQDFLATSHTFLSRVQQAVGKRRLARQGLNQARQILTRLVEHDPENTHYRFKMALNHLDVGWIAFLADDLGTAHAEWHQARQILKELLAIDENFHEWRLARAKVLHHLALLQATRRETDDARQTVLQAVDDMTALAAERPTDRLYLLSLGRSYLLLGSLERSPASARAFRRAVEHLQPLIRNSRDPRILAPWAATLRCLGRNEQANAVDELLRSTGHVESLGYAPCPTGPPQRRRGTSSSAGGLRWNPRPARTGPHSTDKGRLAR